MNRAMGRALAAVAGVLLSGCASQLAIPGNISNKAANAARALVLGAPSSTKARTPLWIAFQEGRIDGVYMTPAEGGWAYSPEHIWTISADGTTWTLVWHHAAPILAVASLNRADAWAVTAPPGSQQITLWHTTDRGRRWAVQTVRVPFQAVLGSLAVGASGQGHVLVSGAAAPLDVPESLFAISHNQLQRRSLYTAPLGSLGEITFPTWNTGIAINLAVFGSQRLSPAMSRTDNGGKTWTKVILPPPPGLSRNPTQKGGPEYIIFAPADFVTPDVGYVALQSPKPMLYRTINGGLTWSPVKSPSVSGIRGISAEWVTPRQGWAMTSTPGPSDLWETSTGGRAWIRVSARNFVRMPQFTSANIGWGLVMPSHPNVYGGPMTFVRTTNGGRSWTPVNIH